MTNLPCRLPAEWEPQDAVLLVWPHEGTDWAENLVALRSLYCQLMELILACDQTTRVVLVVPVGDQDSVFERLRRDVSAYDRVLIQPVRSDDTWARDSGPITVDVAGKLRLQDFVFNGWGNKFSALWDNAMTESLAANGVFGSSQRNAQTLVLEGGAIEVDGAGTLMTTEACLLNRNRNPNLSREQIEAELKVLLGARKINWLSSGYLAGDDTDSHIDTLARLCPNNVIVYVSCDDPDDEHYVQLKAMERELQAFSDADNKPYQLLPLPWPRAIHSSDGHRLPATYANFLIINGSVLVPTYGDVADQVALQQIERAFPNYTVRDLNCRALIEQHGSLHCITMQLPKGLLANNILSAKVGGH